MSFSTFCTCRRTHTSATPTAHPARVCRERFSPAISASLSLFPLSCRPVHHYYCVCQRLFLMMYESCSSFLNGQNLGSFLSVDYSISLFRTETGRQSEKEEALLYSFLSLLSKSTAFAICCILILEPLADFHDPYQK